MALFRYKVVDPAGEVHEGEMEADEAPTVVAQLQETGYLPIRVEQADATRRPPGSSPALRWAWPSLSRTRLTRQELDNFTQELAILLGAGLPLDRSLAILLELADLEGLRGLVSEVNEKVRGGAAFSAALEDSHGNFSAFYINMVKAGEAAGALDAALARLAEYLQRIKELKDTVTSALIYPAILVTVAGVSVVILLAFVVPQFTQMFQDMGSALPLPTRIVVSTGDFIRAYWWMLPLVALLITLYVQRQMSRPARRLQWDRGVLRLPLIGDLVTKIEVARFSRTLGILLGNGVPLLRALANVGDILNNRVLAKAVATVADSVQAGQGLADPLAATGVFPRLAVQMIRVGEESGQLEEMLERVADVYDREVKTTVQRLLTLLEPVLIVGLGVIIAGIIMSILMAVLSVNQLVF